MEEPAILDLVRELDDPSRQREPELEVDIHLDDDDLLLDPWFQRTESEIALLADDPTAKIVEIEVRDYGTADIAKRWAF
jgi:hypothetical protein